MSTKILTDLFHKNLKNPKHFHLYPSHRSVDKNPFFTKFGDDGTSKLNCEVLNKDHLIFEAIGAAEELNAHIGLAREYVKDDEKLTPLAEKLRKIQLVLVDIMDIVSCLQPKESSVDKSKPPKPLSTAKVTNRDIADLEALISHYGTLLPPVEKIVIPVAHFKSAEALMVRHLKGSNAKQTPCKCRGGGKASAALHVAKTVCRRCERIMVSTFKDMDCEKDLLAYMNRLSTYLSQAARISAKFANRTETIYKPHFKGECTNAEK